MSLPPPGALPLGMRQGMDMNMPIPGLDVVQKLFLSLGLDPTHLMSLGMAITVLGSLSGLISYAMNGIHNLWSFIYDNCISSATIHSSDQAYLYIMKWLATHRVSTDCRKFCVTSRKNPNSARVKRYSMYNYHHGRTGQDEEEDDEEEDDLGPKLKYNPAPGHLLFWYRKMPIMMQRFPDNTGILNSDNPDETMVLMTPGRSPNLLRELLAEARAHYLQSESRKTTVYTVNTSNFQKSWDNGRSRASRDISTVIMDDKDKDLILRDTRDYLNPVTARWYAARGLPYRRGYLFYGPPGTGKTSLTLALAGELKLNLYIFNLGAGGGVTDETLGQLFQALPKKCIVLLEDIDCAGIGRNTNFSEFNYGQPSYNAVGYDVDGESSDEEDEEDNEGNEGASKPAKVTESGQGKVGGASDQGASSRPRGGDKPTASSGAPRMNSMRHGANNKSQISFSGLLNAIDGVASHEGRILIMTTNHRERLDPALIRPGRVDVQIEFGFANNDTISRVFTELYKGLTNLPEKQCPPQLVTTPSRDPYDYDPIFQPSPVESMHSEFSFSACTDSIESLAERFTKAVPAGVFTPAELQGFLMMHKHQPQRAVADVADWVEKKLGEKGTGAGRGGGGRPRAAALAKKAQSVHVVPVRGDETRRNSWEMCDGESIGGSSTPSAGEPQQMPTTTNGKPLWSPASKDDTAASHGVVKGGKTLPKLSELCTNMTNAHNGGQQQHSTNTAVPVAGKVKTSRGKLRRGSSNVST